MKQKDLARRHRVTDGRKFRLEDVDPADTAGLDIEKDDARELLADSIKDLRKLQERLYAEGRWAVLVVLQAMDAGGKDSAIEHVMTGINPQGCDVRSFKQPGPIELRHDFLWRHVAGLPQRGKIVIFNRSHYEEVLVVRVHPEILEKQSLPPQLVGDDLWENRFKDIRAFERHLANSGTVVLKFFLHISKDEQARRFLDRIDEADKNWKFSFGDLEERKHWDDYMAACDDMIRSTARDHAPWHVVPANNKWYARMVISSVLTETLERLDPQYPTVTDEERQRMKAARDVLAHEAGL
ncbi:MAG: polyphosphate kinase 2 family protein [Geminicoccaceae bacterium]|jgi:PPK2 family polyphosphate:nucleotide phosphotransferase|nr:polyphosphate kinase 2 family protein [Geminicoccaceae bacterium]MCB9966708.1 polyphosphate kinase 2 family protein [Geminicoccaceae bacterium]HRY27473.1 polyphosphate kinase 2 family protein [Geminicoccaceae bacterium]